MKQSNIKAVIFDFDGTILDSEKYYMKFWIKAVKSFGYKMTKQQYCQIRSLRKNHLSKLLYKWYGKSVDYKEMQAKMHTYRDQCFNKINPRVKCGIKFALAWLQKNKIVVAIATSSEKSYIINQLKKAKLFDYFDILVSSSEVKNGKPAPDVYIHACKQLKLNPSECMAVEDCPSGVISAYKAKLHTVLIPDLDKPNKSMLNLNIKIVKNGYELVELIKNKKYI